MIGPNQYKIPLVQTTGVLVAHVHHVQRDAAFLGGSDKGSDVDIGEAQQRESGAEEIEQCLSIV